jgi:hypothetical protein
MNSLPTFRDNLSGSSSRVKGHYSPRNSPEERNSYLLRDGSLKSRKELNVSDLGTGPISEEAGAF